MTPETVARWVEAICAEHDDGAGRYPVLPGWLADRIEQLAAELPEPDEEAGE